MGAEFAWGYGPLGIDRSPRQKSSASPLAASSGKLRMTELYGGVETGGTWCVCALGYGPDQIVAEQQFPTSAPAPTLARIAQFFEQYPGAAAIGIGSFGPVDL